MVYRLIYLIIHWSGSRLTVEPGGTLENTSSPSVFPTDYLTPLLLLVFGNGKEKWKFCRRKNISALPRNSGSSFPGGPGKGSYVQMHRGPIRGYIWWNVSYVNETGKKQGCRGQDIRWITASQHVGGLALTPGKQGAIEGFGSEKLQDHTHMSDPYKQGIGVIRERRQWWGYTLEGYSNGLSEGRRWPELSQQQRRWRRQTRERQGTEQQLDFVIRGRVEGEREVVTDSLHSWWSLEPLTQTGTPKGWADLEERWRVQCVTVTHGNWASTGLRLTAS